jgi:hypothetical protein
MNCHLLQRRTISRILIALIATVGVALLSGCGGLFGGGSQGGLTDYQRAAVLDAIDQQLQLLPKTDPATDRQTVLDFLRTRPEFSDTGISEDGCVWGHFTDGQWFVYSNNRHGAPGPSHPRFVTRGATIPQELPGSQKTYCYSAMGPEFPEIVPTITAMFAAAGYVDAAGSDHRATVDELKQVRNAGALYLDAHGGGLGPYGLGLYGVVTDTPCTTATKRTYRADLAADRLIYWAADSGVPGVRTTTNLAITKYFVSKYMSFAPDSFVYIDSCSSDHQASFKQAFFSKGASTYAGWTQPVRDSIANAAAAYVMGSLTYSNPPQGVHFAETYPDVKDAMMASNPRLDYDPANEDYEASELIFTAKPSNETGFGSFAPSIRGVSINGSSLTLTGVFGTDSLDGEVLLAGDPIVVNQWRPDNLQCTLPANFSGQAQCKVKVHNQYSNIVVIGGSDVDPLEFFGPTYYGTEHRVTSGGQRIDNDVFVILYYSQVVDGQPVVGRMQVYYGSGNPYWNAHINWVWTPSPQSFDVSFGGVLPFHGVLTGVHGGPYHLRYTAADPNTGDTYTFDGDTQLELPDRR